MVVVRRIVLLLAVTVLGICGLSAQDDDNWITYIVDNQIYQMRADGRDLRLLTNITAQTMQWSSDGQWFLVIAMEGLFRIETDGSNIQQITSKPILYLRHIALSPDNKWIVYTSCPDGYMHDCQLYKIRSDGTDFAHVDASPGYNQYLAWSPDSETCLFSAYDGQRRNIYRMNPAETQIQLLTEGWSMAWSPNGEWIAFVLDYTLYQMRADGSEIEPLTHDLHVLETLSWSPDSEWILFEVRHGNTIDLYRAQSDGTEQERITNFGGVDGVWSPDGVWILFRSWKAGNYDLYRMRADGSEIEPLTDTPHDERNAQWQP